MKSGVYAGLIDRVIATQGVRGALVVAVADGLIVDGRVHVGVQGEAVAALAASLYRRASLAAGADDTVPVRLVELEAEEGRILIAGNGELALMAVMEKRANAGQVRVALRRAVDDLADKEGAR